MEKVVKKAYGMLAFIGWGIEFKNWQVMLHVYRTLVRPHLEYSVQFWSPYYQKDVEALERVKKILPGCCLVWRALTMRRGWRNLVCSHWNDRGGGAT